MVIQGMTNNKCDQNPLQEEFKSAQFDEKIGKDHSYWARSPSPQKLLQPWKMGWRAISGHLLNLLDKSLTRCEQWPKNTEQDSLPSSIEK